MNDRSFQRAQAAYDRAEPDYVDSLYFDCPDCGEVRGETIPHPDCSGNDGEPIDYTHGDEMRRDEAADRAYELDKESRYE